MSLMRTCIFVLSLAAPGLSSAQAEAYRGAGSEASSRGLISDADYMALESEIGASTDSRLTQSDEAPKTALKESEIPVLMTEAPKQGSTSSTGERLLWSLAVVALAGLGVYVVGRYWSKRRPGLSAHQQIKMVTQFHLGPRRSLAVVRVAGESILIGVTDHHISMIKSLSLLDEDLPEEVPDSFDREVITRTAELGRDDGESFLVSRLRSLRDS